MKNALPFSEVTSRKDIYCSSVFVFLLLILFFGVPLTILIPPLRAPDEPGHYARAYQIAQGEFLTESREGRFWGVYLPKSIHDDLSHFRARRQEAQAGKPYTAEDMLSFLGRPNDGPPTFQRMVGAQANSPLAYAPMAAAIWLSERFGASFLVSFYAARLANLALSALLTAWALSLLPGLRWTVLFVAGLPMLAFLRSALSTDALLFALHLLTLAVMLRLSLPEEGQPPARRLPLLGTALLALGQLKQLYLALGIVLLPAFLVGGGKRRLALLAAAVPGVALAVLWSRQAGIMPPVRLDQPAELIGLHLRLPILLDRPGDFAGLLLEALRVQTSGHVRELIGVFGWLDTLLPAILYPIAALTLPALMLLEGAPPGMSASLRASLLCAAVVEALLIFLSQYLVWTPIGATMVEGVQGRYFLPLLPLLAFALAPAHGFDLRRWAAPLAVGVTILLTAATVLVIHRTEFGG